MREIVTEQMLPAPPDIVWKVLTDLPGHSSWNPFITTAGGTVRTGESLDLTISPPGGKPMRFRPRVLVADPGRELRWLGRVLLPGIFDGEHYFRLEQQGAGTRLVHGEHFSGLLVPAMWRSLEAPTRAGFESMNAALAARVQDAS
jgi:hypothetical protein